jgi:hypothetical protein
MSMEAGAIAGTPMAGAGLVGIAAALHGGADWAGAGPVAGSVGVIPGLGSMWPRSPITGPHRHADAPIDPIIIAADDRRRACVQ